MHKVGLRSIAILVQSRRALVAVTGVVAMAIVLSGCLATKGTPHPLFYPAADAPDPALGPIPGSPNAAMVYTTKSQSSGFNIPTWQINFSTGAVITTPRDAMPKIPSWSNGVNIWAPAMRIVNGRYLLMFSASPSNGRQNCIGAATAGNPNGPFVPVTSGVFKNGWCSSSSNTALLDPDLFQAPNGTLWLYLSRQTYGSTIAVPAGDIYAQQLSADGLNLVGGLHLMVSYSEAAHINNCPGFPRLENPQMVADSYNNYDLLMSLGTFNKPCYNTIEVACFAVNGACSPANGGILPLAGNSNLTGTGGASLLSDNAGDGNHLAFAALWPGTTKRTAWWDTTTCFGSGGVACADAATPTAGAATPIAVRGDQPIVVSPGDLTSTPDRYNEPPS
jgi:arabinan endo-1,5-alpha-L-arabinosidase